MIRCQSIHSTKPIESKEIPSWDQILNSPTFIINLERRPDRFAIVKQRIIEAGYTDVNRLNAIDAKTCNFAEEWKVYGSPRFSGKDPKFLTELGRQGCTLSWLKILTHIIDQKIPYTNIFEDDVLFHKDFKTLAKLYWDKTPQNFDFIYIGNEINNKTNLQEIVSEPTNCLHALLFTLQGAIKLKNLILFNSMGIHTIDVLIQYLTIYNKELIHYLWNAIKFHDPKRYMMGTFTRRNNGLVYQDYQFETDISTY